MVQDPAMVKSDYDRVEFDHYETEPWVTHVLLRNVAFKSIWEPACGKGAIVDVVRSVGLHCVGSDIRDYGRGFKVEDFMFHTEPTDMDIVTNPPYYDDIADQFIERALILTQSNKRKVAMLLRNEFDCASSRRGIFGEYPFAMKIVLLRRPRWFKDSDGSPRHNYAWYVWDWNRLKPPTIVYDK